MSKLALFVLVAASLPVSLVGSVADARAPASPSSHVVIAGWRSIGPADMDVGVLALDAQGPGMVYAGGDQPNPAAPSEDVVHGLFRQQPGGTTWTRLTTDDLGPPSSLAVRPSRGAIYLVTLHLFGNEVYRSTDAGKTWQRIAQAVGEEPRALAVDPRSARTLYAMTTKDGVFKSVDAGETWTRLASSIRATGTILDGTQGAIVAVDPRNSRTVYAGGNGLYRSTDAGASWSAIRRGRILGLAIAPRNTRTLYAIQEISEPWGSLIRSSDGGRTWKTVSEGVGLTETERAESLALDFEHVAVAPGSGAVYMTGNDVSPGEATIFKSTNGGLTWKRVARVRARRPYSRSALGFSALAVDAADRVYVATDGAGVYRCDSCRSAVSPPPAAPVRSDGTVSVARGLEHRWVRGFAVSPTSPRVMFAATGTAGLFGSRDAGRSWSLLGRPLGRSDVLAIAVSRAHHSRLFAVVSTQIGPDGDVIFRGAPARSDDGGKTWTPIGKGLHSDNVTAIAVAPGRPEVVFVGTTTGAVFRSVDAGRTWRASASNPQRGADDAPAPGVSSIAVDPIDPRNLYASMYWAAVFRSTDGGVNWVEAPLGLTGGADVRQVVVDPFDHRTVWLGLWGESGILVSRDAGRTWKHAWGKELHEVQTVAVDPKRRGWVYAGAFGPGVFLTRNAGASWRPLRAALPNREVETLFAARTGGVLYVGTDSGGYVVTLR